MGPVAFLFAGQGVDILPSAHSFCRESPRIRALLEHAAATAKMSADELLSRGGRHLSFTRLAQPALVALCLGVCEELTGRGIRPQFVAGHSLGELSAWSAIGAISTDEAVDLAAERGRLMAREAAHHPGGMVALVDEDEGGVDVALQLGRTRGSLVLAARNAPREWVLSGDESAISLVATRFRAVRLKTEGAWHSPAMAGAVDELARAARAIPQVAVSARLVQGRRGSIVQRPKKSLRSLPSSWSIPSTGRRCSRPCGSRAFAISSPWGQAAPCAASFEKTSAARRA